MDGFTLQRGRKLRDELLLHRGDRLSGGIVAGGGGDAVDTIGQRLDALSGFGHGGVGHRGGIGKGKSLLHEGVHGIVFIQRGGSGGGIGAGIGKALHQLPPGVVFAAGADEAAEGVRLRLLHGLAEAIGECAGNHRAIGQLHLGAFAVAAEAVGIHQLALPHREQADGAYAALLLRA